MSRWLRTLTVSLFASSALCNAVEPWADPRLPPMEGLTLWLDVSRLSASASDDTGQAAGEPVTILKDASGAGNDAIQVDESMQPKLLRIGADETPTGSLETENTRRILRFDGIDDHLRIAAFNKKFDSLTVFIVAAPLSNPGDYRGLVSLNQRERKDFESGLTIDLDSQYSASLQSINVEGRGFSGAQNLLQTSFPFGLLHVLEVVVDSKNMQVSLGLNGVAQGVRQTSGVEVIADQLTLGARFYNRGTGPFQPNSFLHGDIAELLVFDRTLAATETTAVRNYLDQKYAPLKERYQQERQREDKVANVEQLVPLQNPPAIQMLVPGFAVDALPVELTNINNVRYRADGKLLALGYDGNISLLSDVDGDGREETVTRFFENKASLRGPIGMAIIPRNHALLVDSKRDGKIVGQGVVVASKGKITAVLDLDGDDVAETERVIATGWKEIPQNVDAVGIAIHPDDGAIYFGLGTAAYNNAYLLDDNGNTAFDLASERGTVQRIAPDLSSRTTVCTGIRFPIGMEFDGNKELFVSDQEGATWLANGNPFDELLQIRPGKHYGFPPRHPKHLPNVFDEPSVFDYAPQHQSTCGMIFNTPVQTDGPVFGPADWRGDLIVCGESRGKLYRTRLIQNADGDYVADNKLIGCLKMLTVDCCISPRGDLIVACHSGGPDWGTGPSGIGKLFRVRYVDRAAAQPTSVWASGPQEVRIGFDRPLDPQLFKHFATQSSITYGDYVAAGDRFESIRPGYAVTQLQQSAPRRRLPIYSTGVTADRQTLVLTTAVQPFATSFAIQIPRLSQAASTALTENEVEQISATDLAYSLRGVTATWEPEDAGQQRWEGWLPHVDLGISRKLTPSDRELAGLWERMDQSGKLTLNTQIDPRGLLFPAVQPNSKLDYERSEDQWITEQVMRLRSPRPFSIETVDASHIQESRLIDGMHEATFSLAQEQVALIPLKIRLQTGGPKPDIRIQWFARCSDGSQHEGPLALHRLIVPWTKLDQAGPSVFQERSIPELAEANWGRGRQVFLSEEAACSKCHVAHGAGGLVGPDLSNLVHRDYASVLRDVTQPSFAINPDFITYAALTTDGRTLTGVLQSDADRILIADKDGKTTELPRAEIDSFKPSSVSIMPEGLPARLGPERLRDLLAYLLLPPPRMPASAKMLAPSPRSRSEVTKILSGAADVSSNAEKAGSVRQSCPPPLHLLLVAGTKDHGPGEHDYPAWLKTWSQLLAAAPGVTVDTAMEWPSAEQIQTADTIVFYQKGSWSAERAKAIDDHLAKGRGLVYLHWAVEGNEAASAFAERIGLASNAKQIKYRHGPLDLRFDASINHPISRNFDRVHFHDESYWLLSGEPSWLQILGTGIEDENPQPLFWTVEPSKGRVFVSILGHYSWTFDDPLFRILMFRGIAWSAGRSVDQFNELVMLGATVVD